MPLLFWWGSGAGGGRGTGAGAGAGRGAGGGAGTGGGAGGGAGTGEGGGWQMESGSDFELGEHLFWNSYILEQNFLSKKAYTPSNPLQSLQPVGIPEF